MREGKGSGGRRVHCTNYERKSNCVMEIEYV